MKPTINKSRLMKEAHKMHKREQGLSTWSECLQLSWLNEKKRVAREVMDYEFSVMNDKRDTSFTFNMNSLTH